MQAWVLGGLPQSGHAPGFHYALLYIFLSLDSATASDLSWSAEDRACLSTAGYVSRANELINLFKILLSLKTTLVVAL